MARFGEAGPGPKGAVTMAVFQPGGQDFYALNGGPKFTFSPAIPMFVNCETQAEVDGLWDRLSAGRVTNRCGWLKDKYGLSWKIVPTVLGRWLQDPDPARSQRGMKAVLDMDEPDIARLRQACEQG